MTAQRNRGEEMYCPACGESMPRTANFCPECGSENAATGGPPPTASTADSEATFIDKAAPVASWLGVVLMSLLAVGTVTESVTGMPVRMAAATIGYVLLALFAAPPVRRYLAATHDIEFQRAVVVIVIVVGTIVNEGLIAPPLA